MSLAPRTWVRAKTHAPGIDMTFDLRGRRAARPGLILGRAARRHNERCQGVAFEFFATAQHALVFIPSDPPSEGGSPGVVHSRCPTPAREAESPARPWGQSQKVGAGDTASFGVKLFRRVFSPPPWREACAPFRVHRTAHRIPASLCGCGRGGSSASPAGVIP